MSHPSEEELAAFALGDADPGDAGAPGGIDLSAASAPAGSWSSPEVGAHVIGCAQCRALVDELAEVAGLTRSVGLAERGGWADPPPRVWDAVAAAIADEGSGRRPTLTLAGREVAEPTPPEPESRTSPSERVVPLERAAQTRRRRGRSLAWAAGVAAAALVVGVIAGRDLWPGEPAPVVTTMMSTQLDTLDTKQPQGRAAVVQVGSGLDLEVQPAKELDPDGGYLEVWLINTDGKRMVSVGVLRPGQSGTFPVSQSLIDRGYTIVDVSREAFDDKPAHSGDSLLRGQLSA